MVELVDAPDSKELGDEDQASQVAKMRIELGNAGRCLPELLVDLSTSNETTDKVLRFFEN